MLEHPETMADWRREPFYKELFKKPVGRKGIGKAIASQNTYSHFSTYFPESKAVVKTMSL